MPAVASQSRLLTLVFTDLVASVALRQKHGDSAAAQVLGRHYSLVRTIAAEKRGREVTCTGDGFFLSFETPSEAVEFALELQRAHAADQQLPKVRIGIHVGEVSEKPPESGSNRSLDIQGLAVDIASRIESLALPGQILLSYSTFDNARQRLTTANRGELIWRAHGRYMFKGHDAPLAVFEVGEPGVAPLVAPVSTEKARRVEQEDEQAIGWRPALGMEMPHRPNWILERKLGEGGFGEVWLAQQKKTHDKRVFKFCYAVDRLRALKREVTLFRLLKESLGERDDIVRILDWQFEEPPFYIEMEYVPGGTLVQWSEENGGLGNVPLATRLELMAQVTDAIAAAHSVGILHKDIKPSNALVTTTPEAGPRIRMIDFGIGLVADRELLAQKGITAMGLTDAGAGGDYNAMSGTHLYMAPELLEGKPATTRSDIYSLGVLLYQMVVGDLLRALATGWERDVNDEFLREDIGACVDGNPDRRLGSAIDLAQRLRTLEARRAEALAERRRAEQVVQERQNAQRMRRRFRQIAIISTIGFLSLLVVLGLAIRENRRAEQERELRRLETSAKGEALRQTRLATQLTRETQRQKELADAARAEAEDARKQAEEEQYFSGIGFAESYLRAGRIPKTKEILHERLPPRLRNWEWGRLLAQTTPEIMTVSRYQIPQGVSHSAYSPDNKLIVTGERSGQLKIYDAATGKKLRESRPHQKMIWTSIFSPDGKLVLSASNDHSAIISDAETLTPRVKLTGHTDILRGAAFSPDGSRVVTASHDKTARVYDASTGSFLFGLRTPRAAVYDVAFSPDGRLIATGGVGDQTARIWDATSGTLQLELTSHTQNILSVAFTPDGTKLLTSGTDRKARMFDVATGALLREFDHMTSWLHDAQFNPDATRIATSDEDGLCRIWDVATGEILLNIQVEPQMYKVMFSQDGRRLLTTCATAVKVLDLDALMQTNTPLTNATSDTERIRVISFPLERGRAWPNQDAPWNIAGGKSLVSVGGRSVQVESFYNVFSDDGKMSIAFSGKSTRAAAYDVEKNVKLADLLKKPIYDAAFSPDGKVAALGSITNTVHIFDTATWQELKSFSGDNPQQAVYCVRFSRDGRLLAAGFMDGTVRVYRVGEWVLQTQFKAHGRPVLDIAFSPDGRHLATGSTDFIGKTFDVQTGDQLTTMTGHQSYLYNISYSHDGSRILTASHDDSVKLFETSTGREIIDIISFPDRNSLLAARFTRDGRAVIIVTSDKKVHLAEAFPFKEEEFPGAETQPFRRRIELYKRQQKISPGIEMSDIAW